MYDDVKIVVRTQDGMSKDLSIAARLHRGSTLCPTLFTLVSDVLIVHAYQKTVGDSREELNEKLKVWRQTIEVHDFHICRGKLDMAEYFRCHM
ncbi:hypothetical protein Lal_00021588 [Lupinus albus]|nr:hypothetical protein Lal_00021588 [Lupinus albus]